MWHGHLSPNRPACPTFGFGLRGTRCFVSTTAGLDTISVYPAHIHVVLDKRPLVL